MGKYSILFIACALWLSSGNQSFAQNFLDENSVTHLVRFLTADEMMTTNALGNPVPLSFFTGGDEDLANNFSEFLCTKTNSCTVLDLNLSNSLALLGSNVSSSSLSELDFITAQNLIERNNLKYGTDIYHAATWEIALALAAKKGFIEENQVRIFLANQLENLLYPLNRATGPAYLYGGLKPIFDPKFAFVFRWLSNQVFLRAPFFETAFQNNISREVDLRTPTLPIFDALTTWIDFKPLTGKNGWAQIIGPLQAEYILNNGRIPAYSTALVNAMNTLVAFSLMQTGIGAFYHAPLGTQGIQALFPEGTILIEDNLVVLAGLQVLKHILLNTEKTPEVILALSRIEVMLNGGLTLNGFITKGLLSFLFNGAFDRRNNIFYTSGTALNPAETNNWRPNHPNLASFTAVNTNLWALSALGVETIDSWFGPGTALKIWLIVREKGGYFTNNELLGFGYSFNNNGGLYPDALMTTPVTAAAITALHSLVEFYGERLELENLNSDLRSLQTNIQALRSDRFRETNFIDARPVESIRPLPESLGLAFLNSSRRFSIPGDWAAPSLPSLNASAWILMNFFDFNPFQYQGKFAGENYPIPETIDIVDREFDRNNGLSKEILVHFVANDLGEYKKIIVRYNLDGSQGNWQTALITDQREGFATLPQGTRTVALSFDGVHFAAICQINPASELCVDEACLNVKTINARLSFDGLGPCELLL